MSFPSKSGIAFVTALAAPVDAGMMLFVTLLPERQSFFAGASTVFCVAVVACTVVIKPSTIPNLSLMTFARTARQLVVHEAFEICYFVRFLFAAYALIEDIYYTYHKFFRIIFIQIDTNDVCGYATPRSGDDNFFRPTLQMLLRSTQDTINSQSETDSNISLHTILLF